MARKLECRHCGVFNRAGNACRCLAYPAFISAVAPYVEQKAKIYNACASVSVVIRDDGAVTHDYVFNEAQRINLRLIDELIERSRIEILGE